MTVYKLTHRRYIEYKLHTGEPVTDNKTIGFFSSRTDGENAAELLRSKSGFADHPNDFFIDEYTPAGESGAVYLVEHSYYIEDDRIDNIVEIGVFCTEDEAMKAAAEYERSARIPVDSHVWDDDFNIDNYLSVAEYSLGKIDYADGFDAE